MEPDHCWSMERVGVGEVPYLLNNVKDTIRIGRTLNNDKVCAGNHVSKEHLKLHRFGAIEDWRNIRWSVVDNETSNGTFVNGQKIPNNVSYNLNPGDLVGMGCPVMHSFKSATQETFVYQVKAPKSLSSPVDATSGLNEEDIDTDIGVITDEDVNDVVPSSLSKNYSPCQLRLKLPKSRPELLSGVLSSVKCPTETTENPKIHQARPSTPAIPYSASEGKDGPIILISSEDGDNFNQDVSQPSSSRIQSPSSKKIMPIDGDTNEPTTSTASGRKSKDEGGSTTRSMKMAHKRKRRKSSSSSETKAKRVRKLLSSSSDSDMNENYVHKPAKKRVRKISSSKSWTLHSNSDMEVDQVDGEPKNKQPSKSLNSRRCEVQLDMNAAKPPKQCLSAKVGTNDNLKWIKVGIDEYRRNLRRGELLSMTGCLEDISDDDNIPKDGDGVVEIKLKGSKSPFSDISSEDELRIIQTNKSGRKNVGKSIKSRPKRCSPISSEEELFVRSAILDTKINEEKSQNDIQIANKNAKLFGLIARDKPQIDLNPESISNNPVYGLKIKEEKSHSKGIKNKTQEESAFNDDFPGLNYSQHEIIILDDSDQEDEYSQNILSQSLFKQEKMDEDIDDASSKEDEFDVNDLLRDSLSPNEFRNLSGGVSEVPADEEEIEILEVSQNSRLFKIIAKKAYKLERQEDTSEQDSPSLLEPIESQKTTDKCYDEDMAMEIMNAVKGSDLNMVGNAMRKVRFKNLKGKSKVDSNFNRDKVMSLVQEEVHKLTIHRVAVKFSSPNWIVREIFYVLKEEYRARHQIRKEDDFGVINEEELSKKVEERLEEDRIVQRLRKEMDNSGETIAECCMEMKKNGMLITEDSLRHKVLGENTLEDYILDIMNHHGCTELLARKAIKDVLDERGCWVEAEVNKKIKEWKEFDEKAASISMELDCDLQKAEEALISENNDAQAAAGIIMRNKELVQKSQILAEAFNIFVEKASSALHSSVLNKDLASQSIMDEQAAKSVENIGCSPSEAKETLNKCNMDQEKSVAVVRRYEERDEIDGLLNDINEVIDSAEGDVDDSLKSPSEELGHEIVINLEETAKACSSISKETPNKYSISERKNSPYKKKPSILLTKTRIPTPSKINSTVRSGPQMIDAPPRRAFNRGISHGTVDNILEKEGTNKIMVSVYDKKNKTPLKNSDGWPSKTPTKNHPGLFTKGGSVIDDHDKSKIQAEKKKKLKEIEERKKEENAKKITENKNKSAPSGKMKKSQPKISKMLNESLINTTPVSRHKVLNEKASKPIVSVPSFTRQRYVSGSTSESPKPAESSRRRNSLSAADTRQRKVSVGGFLEEEALLDNKKKGKNSILKKESNSKSSDGKKVCGKMSFRNIDYNCASQNPSQKVIDASKVPPMPTLRFCKENATKRKSVHWKDVNGMGELVNIRWIAAENMGLKPNNKKRDSIQIPTTKSQELDMNDIFMNILAWNPMWMVEQKKKEFQNKPPPVNNKWRVSPVTLAYQSWDDYKSIFVPLMLHELWASITTEVTEKEEAKKDDSIHVCLQEIGKAGKFHQITCIGLLSQSEKERDLGSAEGTLVQLTLRYSLGAKQSNGKQGMIPLFAYVKHVTLSKRENEATGENDLNRLRQLEQAASTTNRKGKSLTWIARYTISVLSDRLNDRSKNLNQDNISLDKPIILTIKSRIEHELRNFRAVIDLPKSKLYDTILKPEVESFRVGLGSENLHASIKDVPALTNLNSLQKRVVVSVTRACLLEPTQPKICLVHGPPGTGKSRTIIGMIIQFLFSKGTNLANSEPAPRILVVAPSNAAVDELALKLMAAKAEMSEPFQDELNFLRIGREKSMHPNVRPFSFEASIKKIIDKETDKHRSTLTLEKDVALKQATANRLWQRHDDASYQGNADMARKFKREWQEMNIRISKIKKTIAEPLASKVRREIETNAKQQILGGADIVLTTLSSSTNGLMERYFQNDTTRGHRPFSVCIMDEASQCVEPEALIPFKFGFSKLVMVGDHEQLPATVTSWKAKQNDYQQSLFNRLFTYFISGGAGEYVGRLDGSANTSHIKGSKSPVLRLETQYRMHPAIMEWPSRYFYGGQLVSGPQNRISPLSPYTVLETTATEMCRNGQIWNEDEAKYVAQVVSAVRRMAKLLSIGVITFYRKQTNLISLELQNKKIPTEGPNCINVNTVDGFQGSERDVIIISCVRGGGDNIGFLADRQRLNVALTRAKYAMIVIGNIQTLKKNKMFEELVANASERKCIFSLNNSTNLDAILSPNR